MLQGWLLGTWGKDTQRSAGQSTGCPWGQQRAAPRAAHRARAAPGHSPTSTQHGSSVPGAPGLGSPVGRAALRFTWSPQGRWAWLCRVGTCSAGDGCDQPCPYGRAAPCAGRVITALSSHPPPLLAPRHRLPHPPLLHGKHSWDSAPARSSARQDEPTALRCHPALPPLPTERQSVHTAPSWRCDGFKLTLSAQPHTTRADSVPEVTDCTRGTQIRELLQEQEKS